MLAVEEEIPQDYRISEREKTPPKSRFGNYRPTTTTDDTAAEKGGKVQSKLSQPRYDDISDIRSLF